MPEVFVYASQQMYPQIAHRWEELSVLLAEELAGPLDKPITYIKPRLVWAITADKANVADLHFYVERTIPLSQMDFEAREAMERAANIGVQRAFKRFWRSEPIEHFNKADVTTRIGFGTWEALTT